MAVIRILTEKCSNCGACIKKCPYQAIEVIDNTVTILDKCCQCKRCIPICKNNSIVLQENNSVESVSVNEYNGVWVFCEQKCGVMNKVTFELLGDGKRLAEKLGVRLSAVVLGKNIHNVVLELAAYGVDYVYMSEHDNLEYFNEEIYTHILTDLIEEYKPEIVLFGATTYGRSIAPRVASRLNTGLTADCTELDINERTLLQTRPAFGGNLMAVIICKDRRPQIATVRPNTMKSLEPDYTRICNILEINRRVTVNSGIKVLESIDNDFEISIADAEIILAVGRGIKEPKNLKMVEELAKVLGAAIGASRPVVDYGWISYDHQIGQTGRTVKPKIYLACGISGAIQHLVGMQSADTIIAINKDPDAPIFKVANYGIVGDLLEALPILIKRFSQKLK